MPEPRPSDPAVPAPAPEGAAPEAQVAAREPGQDGPERDARFEREVLACLPDLARFARSLTRDAVDAEDLVQQSYLQAYRGYHTFRAGDDPRRWLFTICRNAFLRQEHRASRFVPLGDAGEGAGDDASAEAVAAVLAHDAAVEGGEGDLLDRLDIGPAVDRALAELPPAFRVAVVLVDMEGLSYDEAAAVADVPVGTIRSRLFRARRLLQERLLAVARDAGIGNASVRDAGPRDGGVA